jgi:hypothetical protein
MALMTNNSDMSIKIIPHCRASISALLKKPTVKIVAPTARNKSITPKMITALIWRPPLTRKTSSNFHRQISPVP